MPLWKYEPEKYTYGGFKSDKLLLIALVARDVRVILCLALVLLLR
jgi:hypothetical protein